MAPLLCIPCVIYNVVILVYIFCSVSTVSITAVGEGLRLVSIVLLGGGMYG